MNHRERDVFSSCIDSLRRWFKRDGCTARTLVAGFLALAGLAPGLAGAVDMQVSSFIDTPDPAIRGGRINFSILIENTDADTAHNVIVSYPLPANTVFVSAVDAADPDACVHDGLIPGTVTCFYDSLRGTLANPAGPSRSIAVVLKTTGSTVPTLNSTVTVSTSDVDVNPANDTLSQNTTINNGADLTAALSGEPNPAVGGGLITWTVSGSNLGPNAGSNGTFTTTLPGTLSFVSAGSGNGSWSCSASGQVVTCSTGAIALGAYASFPIVTRIVGVTSGTVTLNGSISATVGDPDLSNNTAVASVAAHPGADLAIAQNTPTPNPVLSGSTVTFVLQPANLGPDAATAGASVSFPLPAGFVVNTSSGSSGWSCTDSGSPATVTCTRTSSLAANATGTLTIVATAPTVLSSTTYSNITATIAPNPGGAADVNAGNNSASQSVTVQPDGLDLSITKSKSPSIVAFGSTINSVINVSNAGQRTAASGTVTVVDALDPTKETYAGFSGANWSCVSAPPNVTCTYGAALGIGASSTLSIQTTSAGAGTATNTATVSYAGTPGDFNLTNNTASASIGATVTNNSPDLAVTIAAATAAGVQTRVEVNETAITYTAVLLNRNIGTAAAARDGLVTLSIPARTAGTNVAMNMALTNTSGTSTAAFTCAGTGSGSTGNVVCTQNTGTLLSPGDTVTFTYTVSRPLVDGSYSATATVSSTSQGDPDSSNNSDAVAVTIDPIADVELVSKVLAANSVLAGTNATYTTTIRNNGPSAASGVALSDVFTLPGGDSGFTFIGASASNGGSCSGLVANTSYSSGTPTVSCSWPGQIASGASVTATFVIRPNWQAGAGVRTLVNVATVSTTTPEDSVGGQGTAPNAKSATLTINPAQVDMLINDSDLVDPLGYDPATPSNNDITYMVRSTNNGPSLASGTGFTFTMTPPAGKTAIFRGDGAAANVASATPNGNIAGGLCDQVGSAVTGPATLTVTCTFPGTGQLANGASASQYLVFRLGSPPNTGGDVYTTLATVIVNETDTNASNNAEGETTTVRVRADLSIVKTPSINPVQLRQPFTWNITVSNAGPGDSQTTGMTDTLPAGTAIVGAVNWSVAGGASGACSVNGQTVTCAFGVLPAGKAAVVGIPSSVTSFPGGGTMQNCATATTSEVDPSSANNLNVCTTLTVQRSSITGTVFEDRDRVGANAGSPQAPGVEPRIAGVALQLSGRDAYGNDVLLGATSDANGSYTFADLSPANAAGYLIRETQPGNFANSPGLPSAYNAGGGYVAGGAGNSTYTAVTLGPNTAGVNYDFPEVRRQSLSGFVYLDTNLSGVRDAGDSAIAGATVRLLNASTLAVVATTSTNGSGAYTFSNLDPIVVYTLEQPLPTTPAGLANGPVNPGLINGAPCSSGCTARSNAPSTGVDRIAGIDLSSGADGTLFNFGEVQAAGISGTVYVDRNRDNTMQAAPSDGRLAGVTITVFLGSSCAGTVSATTTTDTNGNYAIAGVAVGRTYTICKTQPAGYGNGAANPGANGTALSPHAITIGSLGIAGSPGNNFGERLGSISGSVYLDANNDGVRQAADAGIAGVTVTLSGTDAGGNTANRTMTTDATGAYRFDDLLAADANGYTLTEQAAQPVVASITTLNGKTSAGTIAGVTSGTATPVTTTPSAIAGIRLPAAADAIANNFAEIAPVAVSGLVFVDINNNGVQNLPSDTGLASVTIALNGVDDNGRAVSRTAATAADGSYVFAGLRPGIYAVTEPVQPANTSNGLTMAGSAGGAATPQATVPSAVTGIVLTTPGTDASANNFAEIFNNSAISGRVWLDSNNNGVMDAGEAALPGITIQLTGTDAGGAAVARTTTTDASGRFTFGNLSPGTYVLTEPTQPAGTLNGKTIAGSAGGTATPPATSISAITAINLAVGQSSTGNNFAELPPAAITGRVYADNNNNGLVDASETGLPGVSIVLSGTDDLGATVTQSLTTAADGSFAFKPLRPGTYTLTEPEQPAGTINGKTTAGSAGGTATLPSTPSSAITAIALAAGQSAIDNNFGEIAPAGISGRVYADNNNNGLVDASETGLPGVSIVLSGTDDLGATVTQSLTTAADGSFAFKPLRPGTYTLTEPEQPAGTINGKTTAGSAGGTATLPSTPSSAITAIALAAGQSAIDNNFGEIAPAGISGRVYADNNNNGLVDASEAGLPGVSIVLSGTDDLGATVTQSLTTAADGSFAFKPLRPGTYTLTEPEQPAGTINGITSPGTLGGSATAPAVTPSVISKLVLLPGAQATSNNFGEIGSSPDLLVSKDHAPAVFTVDHAASYRIRVRNVGSLATTGAYTVTDTLPAGITLAATPGGGSWTCTGAAGASYFTCTATAVIAAGAANPDAIVVAVNVGAAAATNSPVSNAVMVEGGGEFDARRPSTAERDLFARNPAGLPVCAPSITHNACRDPAVVQVAAALSGTVWYDMGSAPGVLDAGDSRLSGWSVEIVMPGNGAIVATTATSATGSYKVSNLLPGVPYAVRFRDPQSGVVFGYPVNGELAPGSSGATCDEAQAVAKGTASSCVTKGANPQLSVVLAPGQELMQQSLPVDPSGVVYDSGTRQPVPGSIITLSPASGCAGFNPATAVVGATLGGYSIDGTSIRMTVGANGLYQFLFGPSAPASCAYTIGVTPPPGYTFASAAIPPQAGTLSPTGGAGATFRVQPQPTAPTAAVGQATAYYLSVTAGSATAGVINNHIPLDPALPAGLSLSKSGDKAMAEIGDTVRYTVTVQATTGGLPRQVTVVDRLPAGFTYIKGTAWLNGKVITDPVGVPGPTLAFNLGAMPAGGQHVLMYRLRVGVGSQQGDGTNRAQAFACGTPASCVTPAFTARAGSMPTNVGQHRVRVLGGVFGTDACVAGKIFVDCNGNHVQDAEEIGIPGVRLVLSDGTTLIADSEGKYSACGLKPRSTVIKVDSTTLPRRARLTTTSNRNLADAGSLWLDIKNGELHRADFAEGSCSNVVLEQVKARRAQGEVRAPESEHQSPALRFDSKAHGLSTTTSPQQGTDGADQRVPKPRQAQPQVPVTGPPRPPQVQPAPPAAAPDSNNNSDSVGGSDGTR